MRSATTLTKSKENEQKNKTLYRLRVKVRLDIIAVASIIDGHHFDAVHRRHQPGRERHAAAEREERRPLRPGPAHERGEAHVEEERRSGGGSINVAVAIAVGAAKRREQALQARSQGAPLGLVGSY
jgi:hypothetical protein